LKRLARTGLPREIFGIYFRMKSIDPPRDKLVRLPSLKDSAGFLAALPVN
jgi:hypothetical protein